jgi:hypothetical protein
MKLVYIKDDGSIDQEYTEKRLNVFSATIDQLIAIQAGVYFNNPLITPKTILKDKNET